MALRTEMDLVFDEALKKLPTKRAAVSGQLSDQLSDDMLMQLMAELATKRDTTATATPILTAGTAPMVDPSKNHQGAEGFLSSHQ